MRPPTGTPCNECPWRRASCPGWLGPYTAEEWNAMAHGEGEIACHLTIVDENETDDMTQCSGAAIFRANVCKRTRWATPADILPADRETVFGYGEFIAHHTRSAL